MSAALSAVAVIGAGAWGTVLAQLLAQNPAVEVTLWVRRPELAAKLVQTRENAAYVPGQLSERVAVTANLGAVSGAEAAFMAVPGRGLRGVLAELPGLPALISCGKGLEPATFKRPTQVMAEYQPDAALGALSGPNLAGEIARGLPASATVASRDETLARRVQAWLNQPAFRVYTGSDLVGLELGGALKNVIALAAGMCDGLGLGDNAKAALVTRGLAEMVRLGTLLGGDARTFYGLSGLGDLMATCASTGSRNHQAGVRLVRGETLAALTAAHLTAEGIPTVRAVARYAAERGLELPISGAVYDVVFRGRSPETVIGELMLRDAKPEW
ncbi:MAG: Glycerol-3-phosphate dehydrogenase [NAD(P)+] [uncultured Truepera sp.]|uniref:Glycerol-3-phosphate dehydrogenase [NAD(P)+] n=1 Tax=uncultured Truepera sp. TaxID=543023 RepID=A0A6J4V6G4_9DEIN|nr:MAG: Glycerol-3-phosphate dehydrogenase [NAD(P)+] [uncultured Truepera sp.]